MDEKKVRKVLAKYVNVDFDTRVDLRDANLLGKDIGLYPRDLVAIYKELKDICDNESLHQAVISHQFKSYYDILQIMEK